jgi:hypothetical protein
MEGTGGIQMQWNPADRRQRFVIAPLDHRFAYAFRVTKAGLYWFRLVWYDVAGPSDLEWMVKDNQTGKRLLINSSEPGSIRAFQQVSSGAAPVVTLLNANRAGQSFSFEFEPVGRRTYRVQFKGALTDANWTNLTGFQDAASGTRRKITDPNAAGKSKFYRVVSE